MISDYSVEAKSFLDSLPDQIKRAANYNDSVMKVLPVDTNKVKIPGEIARVLSYKNGAQIFRFGYDSPAHIWTVVEGSSGIGRNSLVSLLDNPSFPPEVMSRAHRRIVSTGKVFSYHDGSLAVNYFLTGSAFKDTNMLREAIWHKFRPILKFVDRKST